MADFGNVLRHDYPNVKEDRRVWQIVTNDLSPPTAAVAAILHDLDVQGGEES